LPSVDPVYTWVRLAQRVPVRIAIDNVPPGVPLVSGLTATVTIRDSKDAENGTLLQRVRTQLETSFFGLTGGTSARSGCIPGLSSSSR
jgi:multidrug resistance efflux pump